MNPIELIHPKSGKPCGIFLCANCNRVTPQDLVDKCCLPCECGQPSRYRFEARCEQCADLDYKKQRQKQLEEAQLVQWDGAMIYSEQVLGYKDGWYDSPDDLLDFLENATTPKPQYAFLGRRSIKTLDINQALEEMTVDTYEDAELHIDPKDLQQLLTAVKTFNDKYAVTYYEIDYTKKVSIS